MLLRAVRLPGEPDGVPVRDLRVADGVFTEAGVGLPRRAGEVVHDAQGAVAIPGLWDQHVHVGQTAQGYARVDTTSVASIAQLLALVAETLRERARRDPAAARDALVGFGHRLVDLQGSPEVAALDAVAGPVPVVLIGGDAHHAWMSSAALTALGLPPHRTVVAEDEWFRTVPRLDILPGVADGLEAGVRRLQEDALRRGIVGILDMEWATNWQLWLRRRPRLRVRTATYQGGLEAVPGPSGTPLDPADPRALLRMGPLKVIVDGSLGSRSALCRHPYALASGHDGQDANGHGVLSVGRDELADLLRRARERGLDAAIHAIGDAAVGVALDAFAALGDEPGGAPRGRIEHAQMLTDADVRAMARLGLEASVQPAHLLDDRDATEQVWPREAAQAFRFADLRRAGVPLAFGSDAPVAPIDPWLAMAAAVHRSADARPAWFPAQQLQPREALAASCDGVTTPGPGAPADVVLLAEDPFASVPAGPDGLPEDAAAREAADRLRAVRPLGTFVAGELAFSR